MHRTGATRFQIGGGVVHENGQQFVDGSGGASDRFEKVVRVEFPGLATWPVPGGQGVLVEAGDNRDAAYLLGGESPGHRPSGDLLTVGGTALYDHHGNVVSIVLARIRIVHSAMIHLVSPKIVLEGMVKLGGEDADRPAAAMGTVDSAGHTDEGNLATMVLVK